MRPTSAAMMTGPPKPAPSESTLASPAARDDTVSTAEKITRAATTPMMQVATMAMRDTDPTRAQSTPEARASCRNRFTSARLIGAVSAPRSSSVIGTPHYWPRPVWQVRASATGWLTVVTALAENEGETPEK